MRVRSYVSLAATVLLAAACKDLTGPKNALTADESADLANQIGSAIVSAPTSDGGASYTRIPVQANLEAVPVNITVDGRSVPCPRGGTTTISVHIEGTADQATHSLTADVTGSQLPNACGFLVRGKTVFVTATEPLTATAHVEIANGVPVGVHTVTGSGSFTWSTRDGRSGSCTIAYTATRDYTNHTVSVQGSFCSTQLSETSTG